MRTTLDLDDNLVTELLAMLPGRSKTSAIEHAIELFLERHTVEQLTTLAGHMEIDDLSGELRTRDRKS